MAVDPRNGAIYVTNTNDNTVSVIDGQTNDVTATLPTGNGPMGVAFNRRIPAAYVVNNTDNTVSVINDRTDKLVTTIPVGDNPSAVAVSPTGTIFVIQGDYYNDKMVLLIDGMTNTVIGTVPVGSDANELAVYPRTGTVFVTDPTADAMTVIAAGSYGK
jgi:YVTN family beta-propeller protein